jgi:hypothetical protein
MTIRRRLLVTVLAAVVGAWGVLLAVQRSYQEGPNYTLVDDGLYLGGFVAEPPPGTRAVLNLRETADPYRCETHVWEPIADAEPAPDLDWLRRQVAFLDARARDGMTTYVHCRNGISRSGMVVTAYEMQKRGWSRDEALAFVRLTRPGVRPNPAFMDRLAEWERHLAGGK